MVTPAKYKRNSMEKVKCGTFIYNEYMDAWND